MAFHCDDVCEDSFISSLLGLSMAQEEDKHSLEAKFAAAVKVIRSLPEEGPFQPSDDMMLMFYSYYKQATLGPCNIPRPTGFWDTHGKAKWDAWSCLGNMTKEEAMKNYVQDIQLILETIPISDEVSDLVQKLGNFYTEVDGEGEEAEENEVDRRPFTRPFAQHSDELVKPFKKPTMEGYGDLWDDIQNLQEKDKDSSVQGISVSSEEAEGSKESSEIERKEQGSDWRNSEEEENGDEEDNTDDEEKEEEEENEKDWSPDPRLLMVNDKRLRSDTMGSCSSMEPSMSSFTNGTHSSLNSEVEEEELACSVEPSVQYNSYMHFNGHLSDHSNAVHEKNHRSTDSDNEEFCDSMEHLAMEEGLSASKILSPGSGVASSRQRDLWFESNTTLNGGDDQVFMGDSYLREGISRSQHNSSLSRRGRVSGSQSPKATCSFQQCASVDAACCCVSQSRHPVSVAKGNINEQIATALLRLQHDMATVLHRLHALEAHTLSQSRSSSPRQEDSLPVAQKFLTPSWWPFDFCPLTVAMTAFWPLIAHWLVLVYLQRKRRKTP
ncbi:acyl-CoA-binding domain-containing protein 5A-like isoform X2 [Micropterus dolomieu]|uniref:acyl-CoA-binding domain-containing protein 5A-like isoform X2 n=1 Tax=Micropterus dolomieu TaxID=147949 RepID=UPI001E8E1DEE|nr:acyl-CoA-binding domain-containing protein 5A-like isoform X2 [Micropterus dolomieu]